MLQQTRVEAVKPHYKRWMKQFPTIEALAAASEDEVRVAWEGLGYYRRAEHLHKAAKMIVSDFDGILPHSPDLLRQLPGIGDYTASVYMIIVSV